mmetsp:Transcript_58056/g.152610  ORF Transcript_58056/g.152610 Transcript_58056/m.152610 type:complete len:103 (+) Transcript_58056:161-469(+)
MLADELVLRKNCVASAELLLLRVPTDSLMSSAGDVGEPTVAGRSGVTFQEFLLTSGAELVLDEGSSSANLTVGWELRLARVLSTLRDKASVASTSHFNIVGS